MNRHFRKELFIGFGVALGSVAVFGLGVFFLSFDVSSQADKIAEDRANIASRASSLEALAGLKKDAPRAAEYRQAMNQILVTKDQLLDFSKWLDGLARSRDISFSFSFSGSESEPREDAAGSIAFSLDLNGELEKLNDFLKDVERRSPRFLVSFSGFNVNGGGSNYRMTTSGNVYFRE